MTSWLYTVLSYFHHHIDVGVCEFWTNSGYLLVDSIFQIGEALGNKLMYYFISVTSEIKVEVWKIQSPSCLFNFSYRKVSFPWCRLCRSDMLSSKPVVRVLVVFSGLWVELYHGYQHLSKNSHFSGFYCDLGFYNRFTEYGDKEFCLAHITYAQSISGKTDFSV